MRAASVSAADAEAPTALIAYAAAPRSWAATCVTHAHLAADPRATDIDGVARSGVAWLLLVEKVQDVFGA